MSADFLVAITPSTDKDKALRRINKLSDLELWEITDSTDPDGEYTAEDVREMLRYAAHEVIDDDPAHFPRRDMAEVFIEGRWFMVAGGFSGGDSPSEAFDHIQLLEWAGITDDKVWEERA